jgi:hypothetical protein
MSNAKSPPATPPCGFAMLASQIIITEQYGARRINAGVRTLSPQGLARMLNQRDHNIEDRLNGRAAIRPAEARTIIKYTGDLRLAQWLLEDTPFLPARRPETLKIAEIPREPRPTPEAARVHASAADLAHEASNLLQAAILAVRDLTIDHADRQKLRAEVADVASALATLDQLLISDGGKSR